MSWFKQNRVAVIAALIATALFTAGSAGAEPSSALLDAPMLIVKRHAYMAAHIYDDYYTWHPGGGIYIVENPADAPAKQRLRALIDPKTPQTLGEGVYRDPELSYDAKRIIFAFKGSARGDTSIYEIGIDGTGLRRLTDPGKDCKGQCPVGALGSGRHDINPCYLPDGRIVFTSTRQAGRVPCFNSEVDNLHVMNADGSGIRPISVNNVTEFDPVVMPDGRLLYGRWEYVDKTALYMQSLWTMFPDGSHEEAFFGNNMAKPTAFLDARPIPGTHKIVCSLTPHNGQSVGAIAIIDSNLGRNGLHAITNLTPEYPTEMDQGLARGPSDPWPLGPDAFLIANNAKGHAVIELVTTSGERRVICSDPAIGCYSPMLIKPRPVPAMVAPSTQPAETGRFFVQDIYQGLGGVKRGEVARLRVLEETTRISGIPAGGRWWNQAFLVSWQGAYTVKNYLGVVPVRADGSVYFEAPSGRALYFQAIDREGRLVQSMRTFVAAAPGATRSCIGCHEYKLGAPHTGAHAQAPMAEPETLQSESWGSGFLDFPTRVQPVLDRNCVSCHGGAGGIAGGLDFSGGWTWAFNISYETLLKNTLTGFLNCNNGSVRTSELLPPRTHGSGAAPLAAVLLSGHKGRIPNLTPAERDLILAWMDGNCNYYGTWNWTEKATCDAILSAGQSLTGVMRQAGCAKCHDGPVGNDWINLRDPQHSRILRAPLAAGEKSLGLAWCRNRKSRTDHPLVTQAHQPPDVFRPRRSAAPDPAGEPVVSFASTSDATYQKMLSIIQDARRLALARPRVDMPGADIRPGVCRHLVPVSPPQRPLPVTATTDEDGAVTLAWTGNAQTIGLEFELHRGDRADFVPSDKTLRTTTTLFAFTDVDAPSGLLHYKLVPVSQGRRGAVSAVTVTVPTPAPPPAPTAVAVVARPGELLIRWDGMRPATLRFNVYQVLDDGSARKLNAEPLRGTAFAHACPSADKTCRYVVRSISRRGAESSPSDTVSGAPLPDRREPVFAVACANGKATGTTDAGPVHAVLTRPAAAADGFIDLRKGGHVSFPHREEFEIAKRYSIALRVYIDDLKQMPVIASCGSYNDRGWLLQAYGGKWRWHVGGVSCDGGRVTPGRWVHILATFDGEQARLYQDGKLVGSVACSPDRAVFAGALCLGQYSAHVGPQYQVIGRLADVKIYQCAFNAEQAAAMAK